MFAVWRDMLNYDAGTLRVNLLFNRASPWADIASYIPYMEIKAKEPVNLHLRIPEWVKPGEAKCEVDGRSRQLSYGGRYADVGHVEKGKTAVLTFPISERTERRRIEGFDYTFVIRGNTGVHVDPAGKYLPLYQPAYFRSGRPMHRKVSRFVSRQDVSWW
jgi:hypothetical protein